MEFRRPDQIQDRLAKAQQQTRARWRARQVDEARAFVKSASQPRDPGRERETNQRMYGDLAHDASEMAIAPSSPAPASGGFPAAPPAARPVQRWHARAGGHATPPRPAMELSWWKRMLAFFRILVYRFEDGRRYRARQSQARVDTRLSRRKRWAV